jgi:hypothetical protein
MITPFDESYKKTKDIKNGIKPIEPRYNNLINWLEKTYVKPRNIFCDVIGTFNKRHPRIEIILEFKNDLKEYKLDNITRHNIQGNLKEEILKAFKETVDEPLFRKFNKKRNYNFMKETILNIGIFEDIAKQEIIINIKQEEIDKLIEQINNQELWTISKNFSRTTFFVYTDEQLQKYKNDNIIKEWTEKYIEIIKRYDEYNYFKGCYEITLDSKENFDKRYESSWFNYYR